MVRFDSQFQGATWNAHLATFGEPITLTPGATGGPSAATVSAVVERGRILDGVNTDGRSSAAFAVVAIKPGAIASWTPDTRDTVTFDGVLYAVEHIEQLTPVVELQVVRYTQRRIGGGSSFVPR